MTFTSYVAVCVYIATLILHSYEPIALLSWSQKTRRKRALVLVSIVSLTAFFSQNISSDRNWAIGSYAAAILVSSLFVRHLRQQKAIWMSTRLVVVTRLFSVGIAMCVATLGLLWPNTWGIACIVFGFWNAAILNVENREITNEFRHLKTRLATLHAQQQSVSMTNMPDLADPRDNSNKAS